MLPLPACNIIVTDDIITVVTIYNDAVLIVTVIAIITVIVIIIIISILAIVTIPNDP